MDILKGVIILFLVSLVIAEQPVVKDIGIYGNDYTSDWSIKRLMDTRINQPWHFLLGGRQRLNRRTLEQDVTRLRDYYIQEGFLDVSISANIVIKDDGEYALINIDIDEGARYFFKRFSIGGDASSYFSKLGKRFTLEHGQPFNPGLVETDRVMILREAQNRGHPYAKVNSEWNKLNGDSIEVRFHVNVGKKADFGEINFKNLTYTREDFLRREVVAQKGLPYSYKALSESRENLYRTGLFNVVRIKPDTTEQRPDTLDMDVYLFEKEPRWLATKVAVLTDPAFDMTSDLTLEWGHRNIGGRGIGLAARFVPSFRMISEWDNISNRLEGDISFPYVYKMKTPITLSLYYDPKNRELTDRYDVWLVGGRILAKYSKKNRILHQLSFTYDRVEVKGELGIDSDVIEDISIERKIGYTIERDSRDNFLFPSDGTVLRGANEFAGTFLGGDEHYNKTELLWRRYMRLREKIVYAWRIKSGYIVSLRKDEEVAPHNTFLLGGANTIRGYKERSIGPYTLEEDGTRTPLGGNFYLLTSFELRFPIFWRVYGQVFTDIGNLWADVSDVKFTELKVTAGPGIAVATPVGPIRLDYGFQIVNPEEDYKRRLHLSILYAF